MQCLRQLLVARAVSRDQRHAGNRPDGTIYTVSRRLDAAPVDAYAPMLLGVRARLGRFPQLLQETEHFWHWRQKPVAKIVHCGEPRLYVKEGPPVTVAPSLSHR
jgi:hypothetical protein